MQLYFTKTLFSFQTIKVYWSSHTKFLDNSFESLNIKFNPIGQCLNFLNKTYFSIKPLDKLNYLHITTIYFMIKYNDYVHTCCTESYFSLLGVSAPYMFSETEIFEWTYSFTYDEKKMESQKYLFRKEVRADPVLNRAVDQTTKGSDEKKDRLIENAYVYSFIKVYLLCYAFRNTGRSGLLAHPYNSHVFSGHKELFNIFVALSSSYQMESDSIFQTTISKSLLLDEDVYDDIVASDIYKESFDQNFPGLIFNPVYERLLQTWSLCGGTISIDNIDNGDYNFDATNCPLGNAYYRTPSVKDGIATDVLTYVDFVTCKSSWTDHISKFWNLACFVELVKYPVNFSQLYNFPLDSIQSTRVSSNSIFAEVEAITGIDCSGRYSSYGSNFPKSRGYRGDLPFPR